ncbi:response regulator [Paraburkholderia kururiensis]|uniref:response regulator n=1 Tax=Paraburkholderia kururiensis TaxID=984307 RepID=UPI0005AA79CD|nr:response regulator [Paraburkholderia kururiensis]
MNFFTRQPLFYPTSVVFVDDSTDFLHALQGIFADRHLNRFFTDPAAALDYLSSRAHEAPQERFSGAAYSEFEKKGGNAFGQDALHNEGRFEEIAAIVVDYQMPGMDGIELLSALSGMACAKVLLTGTADEPRAVDAFNDGLIDFYLKKSDAGMSRKLTSAIGQAQRKHCAQRGYISVHDVGAVYRDTRTQAALGEIAAREGVVEYYWRPEQNAVLMFDAAGTPSVFLAWDAAEWQFQCEVVTDEGGPQALREAMEARRRMPVFWPSQAYRPGLAEPRFVAPAAIADWEGAFCGWTRLDAAAVEPGVMTFARWREARAATLASS